jgi:hypothetical protein
MAALPTGWSQAEFDAIYNATVAEAYSETLEWAIDHTPNYLVPNVAFLLGVSAVQPSLPLAVEQSEFNEMYASLLARATVFQNQFIASRFEPYLQPNLADSITVNPPPPLGGAMFSFIGGTMPAGAVLTRASTGWFFNATPALASAANDVARFDYSTAGSGLLGLLVEPSLINSIRNNSGTGVAAGTPGTGPTNWTVTSTLNSVTRTISAVGTEDGIPYFEARWAGTPSATSAIIIQPETNAGVVAAPGQIWVSNIYLRLVAGSLANLSSPASLIAHTIQDRDGAGAGLSGTSQVNIGPTGAALRTQRFSLTRTLTNVSTLRATNALQFGYTSGNPIDLTLRIGAPQLVQIGALTAQGSPILTTAAVVTRAADALTLTGTPPMTPGNYNIVIERVSGTTNVNNVSIPANSYTVPTDVSPLKSVKIMPAT